MRNTRKLKSNKALRSGGQLGGGGQLIPLKSLGSRKRLRARSEKQQRIYEEERIPFVIDFLARNPWCTFLLWVMPTTLDESPSLDMGLLRHTMRCDKPAVDVHEIVARGRGGNIVPIDGQDEDTQFLGLCRDHHTYVTTHPAFAKSRGYSR